MAKPIKPTGGRKIKTPKPIPANGKNGLCWATAVAVARPPAAVPQAVLPAAAPVAVFLVPVCRCGTQQPLIRAEHRLNTTAISTPLIGGPRIKTRKHTLVPGKNGH